MQEPTEYRVEKVLRSRTVRGGVKEYLSPLKFRLPLIFAPFNFRHPLLKISLPLIFATL